MGEAGSNPFWESERSAALRANSRRGNAGDDKKFGTEKAGRGFGNYSDGVHGRARSRVAETHRYALIPENFRANTFPFDRNGTTTFKLRTNAGPILCVSILRL